MDEKKSPEEVFDAWAGDDRAPGMERHHWPSVRQAWELIQSSTGNYLEIGVGNGYGIHHAATNQFADGHCIGLDTSSKMVRLATERTRDLENVVIEQGDFLSWGSSRREPFSLIFSMEVFYYFQDIQAGIEKAFSLLEPGGELWVLVNYYEENPASHDWPRQLQTNMRLWSEAEYHRAFGRAGFQSIEQRRFFVPGPRNHGDADAGTLCTRGVKPSGMHDPG